MHLSTTIAQELDSLKITSDSIFSNDPILELIESYALDSIDYDLKNNKVRLYKEAKITYGNIILTAAYIEIDSELNTVFAKSLKDSIGNDYGFPIFTEDENSFSAKEMTYNFKTKKGVIKEVVTKEGESYIHGKTVKKNQNNVIFTSNGKYTTCNLDHPHFGIKANKIKTIPNNKIITGPAVLEFAGVPVPIALPFGFFPNQKKQSSGLIFPIYGESASLGFFLRNGGYYFAINDKIDLSLTGDIYSKGSWGIKTISNYKKRYRYNGQFNISYASIKSGSEYLNTLNDKRDFFIRWSHNQDPKASRNSKFSANINAGSSSYHQNNSYSDNDYLSNTFQSSVAYSKSFSSSNLAINLRHNQNTLNNTVNLSLPELNYSVNRFYPLRILRNNSIKKRWFDKLSMSYNVNAKNQISTIDSLLFTNSTISNLKNGVMHSIPVSTSFKAFKHLTISPRFNYNERWYFDRLEKRLVENEILNDTISGFNRVFDYSVNLNASTKLYGLYNFKKGKIKALRHVITPNVSFSYRPDFSNSKYGYYDELISDTLGNTLTYSKYQNGIYGSPGSSEQGNINLGIANIIEIKTQSKSDTVNNINKVKILENFNIQSSYNIFADSLNFSLINISGRTKLFKRADISFNSVYDPYIINSNNQRINKFYFNETFLPGRFLNSSARLNFNINGGKSDNKFNEFIRFNIPWTLNVNYTVNYNKFASLNQLTQSLNFSGDINLTEKWKIGFNSGYDFINKDITYTSLDFYRDLHCWEMRFKWIPFGFHQSYNFTIRVKASVLQDLKWEKKKDWYDYN
ncbi:MAG: putative LPS assembly protein LptD [Flavobacteriales bacterium]